MKLSFKKKFSLIILSLLFILPLTGESLSPDNPGKAPKRSDRPTVALVLSGGGARGYAELPILELIEELDIPVDIVVGTSIGSIMGGFYSAGYSPKEIANIAMNIDWPPLFNDEAASPYESILGDRSLFSNPLSINLGLDFSLQLGDSIATGQNVYDLFRKLTIKYPSNMNFDSLPIPFRAMVTNIESGESEILHDGDIAEAMRSSMSMPGVFSPYKINDKYYMDGGVRYNLAINVVKEMGYDIIIAVEITPEITGNKNSYNSNPTVALMDIINIAQRSTNKKMYEDADLVVFPDLTNYTILDFQKCQQIYDIGKETAEEYRNAFEELRKKIYPKDYDSNGKRISEYKKPKKHGSYMNAGYKIPSSIKITGALPQDKKSIEKSFDKIKDEEFTSKKMDQFIRSIMITGNYTSATPKLIETEEEDYIDLQLEPKTQKSTKIIVGANFTQVLSTMSMTNITIDADAQIRGLTGIGSIISFKGSFINNVGLSVFYHQPFTPNLFMQLRSDYFSNRFTLIPNTPYRITVTEDFRNWDTSLMFGIRTNFGNLLKVGPFISQTSTSYLSVYTDYNLCTYLQNKNILDSIYYFELNDVLSTGVTLDYTLDTMNRKVFPSSGFYLNIVSNTIIPLSPKDRYTEVSEVLSANMKGAFALNNKFSVNVGLFAGSDVTSNLTATSGLIPTKGFSSFDRAYFPQNAGKNRFGIHKVAASLAIQFQPFKQLTILGGELLVRLEGTCGNIGYTYKQLLPIEENYSNILTKTPFMWSASLGAGIRIKEIFSVLLRAGYGCTEDGSLTPFFTIDIGTFRF